MKTELTAGTARRSAPLRTPPRPAGQRVSRTARPPGLDRLLRHVRETQGVRCDLYRDGCLKRRLDARLRRLRVPSYTEYLRYLRSHPAEERALLAALTVNVSRFFRNAESFRALARRVLPELATRAGSRPLHCWSAGTAGGEEAYTLVMLWEGMTRLVPDAPAIRVLATDVDPVSLARGAAARYDAAALAEVPPEDRARWFVADGGGWRVRPELTARVRFRRADLTAPTRQRGFDLIVCRNVLIYFQRELQEAVVEELHRALRPGGFLMLGKVEMLTGAPRRLFEVVDARERLFRKPGKPPASRERG